MDGYNFVRLHAGHVELSVTDTKRLTFSRKWSL